MARGISQGGAGPRRRFWRGAATIAGLALLLTLVAAPSAKAQLDEEGTWAGLLRYAVSQLNTPGEFEVELGRIESRAGGETFIHSLAIRDDQGVWLSADALSVVWDASAALGAAARFPRIAADRLEIARVPVTRGDPPSREDPEAGLELAWPRPPIALEIGALEIKEAVLGAPLLGEAVAGRLSGAFADGGDLQSARILLERSDGGPALRFALSSRRDFAAEAIDLSIEADEAAGGLVGRLLGAPEANGRSGALFLRAAAKGEGGAAPLSLVARADGAFEATAEGRAEWGARQALRLAARATPGPLAGPRFRAAAAGGATLDLDVAVASSGAVRIGEAALASPALSVEASGEIDPERDAVALTGRLQSADPAALAALAGLEALAALEGRLEASGALSAPTGSLDLSARGAAGGFGGLEAARLTARVAPKGGRGAALTATLETSGLALASEAADRLIGAAPGLEARGGWDAATLDLSQLSVAAAALEAEGSARMDLRGGDGAAGRMTVTLAEAAPALEALGLTGDGRGALALSFEGVGGEALAGVSATGGFEDLVFEDSRLAAAIGPSITLDLAAEERGAAESRRFEIERLRIAAASLAADGRGGFSTAADRIDLAIEAAATDPAALGRLLGARFAAAELSLAAEGALSAPEIRLEGGIDALDAGGAARARRVALEARATLSRDERYPLSARLALSEARYATPALTAMLGAAPEIRLEALYDGAVSALRDIALRLEGDAAEAALTGEARLAPLGAAPAALDLRLEGAVDRLEAFAPLRGAARLSGALGGPPSDPALDLLVEAPDLGAPDAPLQALRVSLAARALVSALEARLEAEAETAEGPGLLVARAKREGAALEAVIEQLALAGATGEGRVLLGDDGIARGAVALDAPDLSRLSTLAGLRLAGAAGLEARLSAAQGAQALEARLSLRDAAAAGEVAVESAEIALAGPLTALATRLNAEGLRALEMANGALSATALVNLAPRGGDDLRAEIQTLEARAEGARVALGAPTQIRARGAGLSLAPTRFEIDHGAAAGAAEIAASLGRRLEADLAFEETPLGVLGALGLAPLAAGRLSGRASLSSQSPAEASADLRVEGLGFGAAGLRMAREERFDARLRAAWRGGPLEVEGEVTPTGAPPLSLAVAVPMRPGRLPSLEGAAPLEGRAQWRGEAARLWPLAASDAASVSGPLEIDLSLGGRLDAPELIGDVTLSGGRIDVVEAGAELWDADLTLSAAPDGTLALAFDARDAPEAAAGRVSLTGEGSLTDGDGVFTLTLDRAALLRREDLAARLDGRIEGALGGAAPFMRGALEIGPAELRLIGGGVSEPPLITVRDRSRAALERTSARQAEDGGLLQTPLDLTIRLPERVFARGRGLDSEWAGALEIGGVFGAPEIVGEIEARRGVFAFAGRPFALAGSQLIFTGPPTPELAIRLTRRTNEIEGAIEISGPATAPDVGFSATPSLPEDEVLPQLVFGRSLSQLTSLEAAQLASGLATLTSGEPGALDAARDLVGVDKLSIDSGASGQTRVNAGTYVAPGVFVEGREGVDPADRAVRVEIEVSPRVRVEGEAGAAGDVGLGLQWRQDY